MFEDLYAYHFRRIVLVILRNSFCLARFISWDDETKRATLRSGRAFRLFQMAYASFTFPILPFLIFQSFTLTVEEGQHDSRTILVAYLFTFFVWKFLPFSWVLARYSGASKVLKVAEATSNLDKQFTGVHNFIA